MGMLFARRRKTTNEGLTTTKNLLNKKVDKVPLKNVNSLPNRAKVEPKKEALPLKFKS